MAGTATAANVALFADTSFVDYSPPSTSSEAYNMQVALTSMGHSVTTFTGTAAASWSAALAGAQILVVPEQENGTIGSALPAPTITVIQNFVNGGGRLIVADDYRSPAFLNTVFGFSIVLDGTGAVSAKTGAAAATVFAAGPASLANNDATDGGAVSSSLPGGATCAYAAGTQCMVYEISQGSGRIMYLAYDFFDFAPNGSQDGGWLAALQLASGGTAPPQPSVIAVPAVPPAGLALLGALVAALAGYSLRRRSIR